MTILFQAKFPLLIFLLISSCKTLTTNADDRVYKDVEPYEVQVNKNIQDYQKGNEILKGCLEFKPANENYDQV